MTKTWVLFVLHLVLAASIFGAGPSTAAEPQATSVRVVWDFAGDKLDWSPLEKSIELARDTTVVPPGGVKASLHVSGSTPGNSWNYTRANGFRPLQPGQLYRLSAWLKVAKLGPGTLAPYFCAVMAADPKGKLFWAPTDAYDVAKMDTWQQLVIEFRAPEQAACFWVTLDKGGKAPSEIDAWVANVVVEPIQAMTQYRLEPLPAELARRRGLHPRLYIDATRVAELKKAITTTHASLWPEVRAEANEAVKSGPPKYRKDEQSWQREVGDAMPALALAWLLTDDRKYLDSARAWALASCGYETWGLGTADGVDQEAGHQLFGLAIVYDWCYAGLDEETRRTIRQTFVRRAGVMFEAGYTGAYWRNTYLQNHLWVNMTGLAAAGLAVYDEVDEASRWIGLPLAKFKRTMAALGPDGASHEGAGYWEYGAQYMLRFMDLSRALLGVDFYDHAWWRHTADYRLYLGLPHSAWTRENCIVDIADCRRLHWRGPDYVLRCLAREYKDSRAQWLADAVDQAKVNNNESAWQNLIWFDPAVKPLPPAAAPAMPTMHHFEDMGIVSSRSDWSGNESLVVFKCGPYLGHQAMAKFRSDPGGGHVHPDTNHFVLFGAGEWLVRDDGYRAKWTDQHNTLLVDNRGQLGEGQVWFDGTPLLAVQARPKVLLAESSPAFDHIVGDATAAYPGDLGLKRFVRHLIFVKPDVLLVVDDIEMADAAKPRQLELRFHTEARADVLDDHTCLARGQQSVLRVAPLAPQGVEVKAESMPLIPAGEHGKTADKIFTLRLSTERAAWRNPVALTWSATGKEPPKVEFSVDKDVFTFKTSHGTVTLDWTTGAVRLKQ